LAHACAGTNIEGLNYIEGIRTAVEAIGDRE
jgi:hypothetical protein